MFRNNEHRRFALLLVACIGSIVAAGCGVRYDMQDQPRYRAYKKSEFFVDGRASRDVVAGTVARGQLRDNPAFFTGQIENADPNAVVQSTTDAAGNTIVTSFPNAITEFPVPVTKELVDRGEERYNIYCSVCHGPLGNGDGMIVRRGFPKPPTYHDDRLRNAPVGHFFDVITRGFGRMSSYAEVVSPADRWAIVAYIRALQLSQNPGQQQAGMNPNTGANTAVQPPQAPANTATTNTNGGAQ